MLAPEPGGSFTGDLLEDPAEIGAVGETGIRRNAIDALGGLQQAAAGLPDAHFCDVEGGGGPVVPFEGTFVLNKTQKIR